MCSQADLFCSILSHDSVTRGYHYRSALAAYNPISPVESCVGAFFCSRCVFTKEKKTEIRTRKTMDKEEFVGENERVSPLRIGEQPHS